MNREQWLEVAQFVYNMRDKLEKTYDEQRAKNIALDILTKKLADTFAMEFVRFDSYEFLKVAGTIDESGKFRIRG